MTDTTAQNFADAAMLEDAAARIDDPDRWTTRTPTRDKYDIPVLVTSTYAVRWCALGSLQLACFGTTERYGSNPGADDAWSRVTHRLGLLLADRNPEYRRMHHREVITAFADHRGDRGRVAIVQAMRDAATELRGI